MITFEELFCRKQYSMRLRDAGISQQTLYAHFTVFNAEKQKEAVLILPSQTPAGFNEAEQKYYKKSVAAYSLTELLKALGRKSLLLDVRNTPANDIALKLLRVLETRKDTADDINMRLLDECGAEPVTEESDCDAEPVEVYL